MTELLLGTKKGLFVLEGEPGAPFEVTARAFAGEPVEYAMRDPRSGRVLASVTSPFYGPKIWYTDDPAGEWEQAEGVELPPAATRRSSGSGCSCRARRAGPSTRAATRACCSRAATAAPRSSSTGRLWQQPSRDRWQPGAGGLCLHSIVPWPGEPDRLAIGDLRRRACG